ncbi:MAG: hypothetical protein FWG25_09815 [Promicromonosporaceae bacterium]|nr:hypothetical protein [Promicromonosporaceae bacterium]
MALDSLSFDTGFDELFAPPISRSKARTDATFGPFTLTNSRLKRGTHLWKGNNFRHGWHAARFIFIDDGGLSLANDSVLHEIGAREAAVCVGWERITVITDGAKYLQVDVAVERTGFIPLLALTPLNSWRSESLLPGATSAALVSLIEHGPATETGHSYAISVIEAMLGSLLRLPVLTAAV